MSNAFHIAKLIVALAGGVAAAVCLFVSMPHVVPLAVTSIAFSILPEG